MARAELFDDLRYLAPALDLKMLILARGDLMQPADHSRAIRQTVGSDPVGDAGGKDLLGTAAADLKQRFER